MREPELPDLTTLSPDQKNDLIRRLFEQVRILTVREQGNNKIEGLVDFLSRNASHIDPNELNRIRCQVLDLYFALNSGRSLNVETEQQLWLYSSARQQVIFPYSVTAHGGKIEAAALYSAWTELLATLKLWFVKPTKEIYAASEQTFMQQQLANTLRSEVASFAAVDKIYLMGSALRGEIASYLAPFVNGPEAKLGSDINILVEINSAREEDISKDWQLINQSEASSHCSIYHVSQLPVAGGAGEWAKLYPNVKFIQHSIDAYVFFPSRGHHEEKDAFLSKFGAKLFYDRALNGVINRPGEEERVAERIAELYSFPQVKVEKMKVNTENVLYKVFSGEHGYVLKLFKASGSHQRDLIAAHTAYEEKLITQLKSRGILTAGVIPVPQGGDVSIEGSPALLFELIHGVTQLKPEYPLGKVCETLAKIHQVQMDHPLDLLKDFSLEDVCSIWLPKFQVSSNDLSDNDEIANAWKKFSPSFKRCDSAKYRNTLYASSPSVHNHGDVTPKNVITDEQGRAVLFDFNNAYFGPRIADVLDGAFEFSLAEQYIHLADFARFDAFILQYTSFSPFTVKEIKKLPQWIELIGLIKFIKEVRELLVRPTDDLRRKRALAIADFVLSRIDRQNIKPQSAELNR